MQINIVVVTNIKCLLHKHVFSGCQSDNLLSGGGGQVDLLEDGRRPRDGQQANQEEEVEKDRPEPVRHFRIKHSAKV